MTGQGLPPLLRGLAHCAKSQDCKGSGLKISLKANEEVVGDRMRPSPFLSNAS